jgi:hypothetical protein
MSWASADSRDYITPFGISGLNDVPRDILVPPGMPEEFDGLFLPQDLGWFGARKFPPRVLVFAGDAVWVVARGGPQTRIPLHAVEVLECGRILLSGWIRFEWNQTSLTLPYNRQGARSVEGFLQRLKNSWLPEVAAFRHVPPRKCGREPDLKFGYAKSDEALEDERTLLQFFQPLAPVTERRFLWRRKTWSAGDLLVVSSRRVLWITERHRSSFAPYGTISRSTPLAAASEVRCGLFGGKPHLEIELRSGKTWQVPLHEDMEKEAGEFPEEATRLLHTAGMSAGALYSQSGVR